MSGALIHRPEVEAVKPELEASGVAAVPSWRNDGRWESWVRIGNITSGPSETYATRDDAIAAGHAWRETHQ
ncbi:hypothetical protein EN871_24440 [bacterium M00.F.Ca.ET.228.01.1.1]|uniref:hypothetical protein n=1 Tax=Burkholderiaceae TaxID=119060 RepID=UPI0003FE9BAB|nr:MULTISPECIES: hypothetical protein [Burkholderiaceae]TGP41199.1 hypothetical protein EN871_24440 [bacterium M00.F.Ca.ET.228.01.1.1]TGR97745.1 hypothetical protein EN834_24055 [bacterium M00.F.Ca.ET.191.01.1.1]TGU01912.1 hypothetical protein EN798_24875 [bacterium M00.F.Ca.ET.155.01.1.1]MBW0451056.1 hypothetical protein [Paraburkholderia phenoliruptrix]MBW9101911.1 hypothetical protein [Paraburkholderia phenoliruptrix]